MSDKPIIFNDAMVRPLIEGRKTQTRRIVKHSRQWPIEFIGPEGSQDEAECWGFEDPNTGTTWTLASDGVSEEIPCPYGHAGSLLWVRETFYRAYSVGRDVTGEAVSAPLRVAAYEGEPKPQLKFGQSWRKMPSIHMPRWASRITLEITDVRVERLQDISEDDAMAEGIPFEGDCPSPRDNFSALWESINGPGAWDQNPWVWVIEFRAHYCNIDALLAERGAA